MNIELIRRRIKSSTYKLVAEFIWHFLRLGIFNFQILISCFAFFSNEYRQVPLTIQKNICAFFENEFNFIKDEVIKDPSYVVACPIKKVLFSNYFHISHSTYYLKISRERTILKISCQTVQNSRPQFHGPKSKPWSRFKRTKTI